MLRRNKYLIKLVKKIPNKEFFIAKFTKKIYTSLKLELKFKKIK